MRRHHHRPSYLRLSWLGVKLERGLIRCLVLSEDGKHGGADYIAGNIGLRWGGQYVPFSDIYPSYDSWSPATFVNAPGFTLLHRSCSSPDFAFSLLVR